LHGEQDMRKMGGLKKWQLHLYFNFITSFRYTSFSGFSRKTKILLVAFEHNKILWFIASLASLMTAFY
jgi:NADH-quinone oxidoreductase subunit L